MGDHDSCLIMHTMITENEQGQEEHFEYENLQQPWALSEILTECEHLLRCTERPDTMHATHEQISSWSSGAFVGSSTCNSFFVWIVCYACIQNLKSQTIMSLRGTNMNIWILWCENFSYSRMHMRSKREREYKLSSHCRRLKIALPTVGTHPIFHTLSLHK